MPLEHSLRLIKGFPIIIPVHTWVDVCPKDMKLCPSPDLVGSSNLTSARVMGYMEELKNNGGRFLDLKVDINFPNDEITFQAYLYKDVVTRLSQLAPKPSLNFNFSLINSERIWDDELLRKKLDLTEELESSQTGKWRDLLSSGFDQSMGRKILCDIFFEWEEPSEDAAATRPSKSTRINTTSLVQNLFGKEESKDLTIVVGNGAEVKCHRLIFEAQSDVLSTMLSPNNGMVESETGRIKMTENSEEGMSYFIRYLYGMDLNIDELACDVAIELFKTAHKYKLPELEGYFAEMLMAKEGEWFSPDDLLELYFHLKNVEELKTLHGYLLRIMLGLAQEIKACGRFKELKRTDPEATYDLVWTLFEKEYFKDSSGLLLYNECLARKDDGILMGLLQKCVLSETTHSKFK